MGRKPNQIILTFFERGTKLKNASNRYEYTCKSCGQHFHAGRTEALIRHLKSVCPDSAARERLDAFQSETSTDPQQSNLTGSEALAEASTTVEDHGKPGCHGATPTELVDPLLQEILHYGKGKTSSDPAQEVLNRTLSSHAVHHGPETRSTTAASASVIQNVDTLNVLFEPKSTVDSVLPDRPGASPTASRTAEISSPIAGAVLPRIEVNSQSPKQTSEGSTKDLATKVDVPERRANIARGRLTEARRQEVHQVRQYGACMRCRMLKKTVS